MRYITLEHYVACRCTIFFKGLIHFLCAAKSQLKWSKTAQEEINNWQKLAEETHLAWLHSSNNSGIDKRFGPLGRVFDERLPLPRQSDKLLLLLVKVGVDTMLKVGRSRDLDARLLLLGKHGGGSSGCSRASDLQRGKSKWEVRMKSTMQSWCNLERDRGCGRVITRKNYFTIRRDVVLNEPWNKKNKKKSLSERFQLYRLVSGASERHSQLSSGVCLQSQCSEQKLN